VDLAMRTNVVANAQKMVDSFHMYYDQLSDLMAQQDYNLVTQTGHVNEILTKMIDLNRNIQRFELSGSVANDLRDERNLLLDELSTFMDITYTEISYEPPVYNIYGIELAKLQVYVGDDVNNPDMLLVSHLDAFPLEIEEVTGLNPIADDSDPPLITHQVSLASGTLFGREEIQGLNTGILLSHIDLRDGMTADNQGIPYLIDQLNTFIRQFVGVINETHQNGYSYPYTDLTGSYGSSSGLDFFNADGLTANTIALDELILASGYNIAASSIDVTVDSDGHMETGNNENALDLIRLRERTDLDEIGSFEGFYKNFLGNLASEVSLTNHMRDAQDVLVTSIHNQRLSVSAVSEDEEMTDLIRFQHAYNASARAITTMDEALDKLINGTGRVGL
jgi:flagellar hook-associated protein 1 FlgK